jgi:hypothetical protein
MKLRTIRKTLIQTLIPLQVVLLASRSLLMAGNEDQRQLYYVEASLAKSMIVLVNQR